MRSMLCPVLISRDNELRQLTDALASAEIGQGSIVFLTGDPGVGKTRLANELAAVAESGGFHVVSGRAVESASPLPFRPVTEALMKIARSEGIPRSPEIAAYRPALATLVPVWGQPEVDGEAEMSPLIIGEALIRLLSLYGPPGTLLIIEDIHWADPETLAIVQYLADNLAGKQVLCVATVRDGQPSAGLDAVRSIHARRAAPIVEVPRLTEREVEQLAACCLGTDVPPAVTKRLLASCDGLPFAVEEILAAAASSGEITRGTSGWLVNENITTGVPVSIVSSVRNRLAAVGPQVTNLVVSAAVLGRQFDWTLLPRLAGMTESAALAALDRAKAVQLIEPCPGSDMFRFRHSLTRDAIVSDLLPPDRASRSAAAAAAIDDAHPGLPGIWCVQAAELHKAAGNRIRAANLLLEASRRAQRQGSLDSAAATLQDARQVLAVSPQASTAGGSGGSPPRASTERMLAIAIDETLAETLEMAGDYGRLAPMAANLIETLELAGADPRRQAIVRIRTARAEAETNPVDAANQLAVARSIADNLHDTALASRIDVAAARCALVSSELDRAEQLARRSLMAAEQAGLTGWAADVALESLEVLGRRERLRDLNAAQAVFTRAYQIATRQDFCVRRIEALYELGALDALQDGVAAGLLEARKLAQQAGAISTATVADLELARLWSLKSDLSMAMSAALACEQSARRIKARKIEARAVSAQAMINGITADRNATFAAAERAEAIAPGDREVLFATWCLDRVTASLFSDDISRAIEESMVGRAYAGDISLDPPLRPWGFYAILQAVAGLDGRGAIAQARDAGAAVGRGWTQGLLAYSEAVLEGRDGHPVRATALAEAGKAQLAPFASWWNHLARRLVATAALEDGWGQPTAWLRDATVEFQASGHVRLASACRGMLRKAGERVPRSGRGEARVPTQMRRLGITSREMDVYLLVAQGLSNAEIADRLFISPKTVETHVASLISKTGQAGRRELVAHAARSAEHPVGRTELTQDAIGVSSGLARCAPPCGQRTVVQVQLTTAPPPPFGAVAISERPFVPVVPDSLAGGTGKEGTHECPGHDITKGHVSDRATRPGWR